MAISDVTNRVELREHNPEQKNLAYHFRKNFDFELIRFIGNETLPPKSIVDTFPAHSVRDCRASLAMT